MAISTKLYVARCSSEAVIPTYVTERHRSIEISAAGRSVILPRNPARITTGLVMHVQGGGDVEVSLSKKVASESLKMLGFYDMPTGLELFLYNYSCPNGEKDAIHTREMLTDLLEEQCMNNGFLSAEQVELLEGYYGCSFNRIGKKANNNGIYLIEPGDKLAVLKLARRRKIKLVTEPIFDNGLYDMAKQDDVFGAVARGAVEVYRNKQLNFVLSKKKKNSI